MPNINAFRPLVHKEEIFKGFYYIQVNFIKSCPLMAWPLVIPDTLFEQS